jgi:hypothetical protein
MGSGNLHREANIFRNATMTNMINPVGNRYNGITRTRRLRVGSWSVNEIRTAPNESMTKWLSRHPSNSCDEMAQQTNVVVWCLGLFPYILKFLPCPYLYCRPVAQRQAWFGVERQTPASREDQCEKCTRIAGLPACA